jgi:hypothetical protein
MSIAILWTTRILHPSACAKASPPAERRPARFLHIADHQRWLGDEADPRDLLKPYPDELTKRLS